MRCRKPEARSCSCSWCGALVTLCALVCSSGAAAHHSVLGFDGSRQLTLQGVVTDVIWANPHAYLAIDSGRKDARWVIEAESPLVLQRLGWTRTSIRPGDRISTVGAPARDGSPTMRCQFVTVGDGLRLPCYPAAHQ